ncbi:hypothetical protein CIK05_07695 [Bdellovibrio sp. qaytius]|nr:hypothetical protein CIK05_07695 [Bdellovibrio sp. qaytius]
MRKILKYFYNLKETSFVPPKIQCHRGFWVGGLVQNSLASLQKAYELGYKMSEFDIRITKDLEVILFHDDFIGSNKVSNMTLAEVNAHHKVDTFEEALKWFSKLEPKSYYLNIEVKSKFVRNRKLEAKVLELILKYKVQSRVLISSFNPMSLAFFRKNQPAITRALLLTYNDEHGNNFVVKSQVLNMLAQPHFLHLDEKYWSQKRYKNLLKWGVPIVLWTCNDLEKVKKYISQGVFGVISDSLKPHDLDFLD